MDFTREFRESRFPFVIFVRCYVIDESVSQEGRAFLRSPTSACSWLDLRRRNVDQYRPVGETPIVIGKERTKIKVRMNESIHDRASVRVREWYESVN